MLLGLFLRLHEPPTESGLCAACLGPTPKQPFLEGSRGRLRRQAPVGFARGPRAKAEESPAIRATADLRDVPLPLDISVSRCTRLFHKIPSKPRPRASQLQVSFAARQHAGDSLATARRAVG